MILANYQSGGRHRTNCRMPSSIQMGLMPGLCAAFELGVQRRRERIEMNQTLKILMAVSFLLALAILAETSPEVERVQDSSDKQGLAKASAKAGASSAAHIERIENGIEPVEAGKNEPPVALDIEKLMKVYNVTGMSVAAIDDYKIAWTKTYGVTEPGGTTLVTPKTLFQAGSISKPVAATGMLALVQQGKLSLDEDVNQKLKTWKVPENEFTKDKKVTLRRLASHSAGLTVHGFPGYDVDETIPTLVQIFNGQKPANTAPIRVDFIPGSDERYSGGGITIEQQLMMDVSGQQFPALMKESVLDKLGMSDSSYEQPQPAARAALTAGGTYGSGKPVHGKWHVYPEMAAAGLWTTPTDLAKFAIEIALSRSGKSNKVLSQKTTEEMLTIQSKNFGIGFAVSKEHSGEFGHDGADEGFQALLLMNYVTGQGAAIMANSDNGILVAEEYLRSLAREYTWKFQPDPRSAYMQLRMIDKLRGIDSMLAKYDEMKASADPTKRPQERVLNELGYADLYGGKPEDGIKIFQKNAQEFPESSNVYDSLGEAYAAAGKKALAIENYEKSIKLDPKNQNGIDRLKKLKGSQ
jgi:CubicO group peptidase (beta-lactamase class C family)